MKKIVASLAILCLGILFLASCRKSGSGEEPIPAPIEPPAYAITATLSPKEKTLSVTTEISYSLPADGIKEIPLRLYANLYREGNLPAEEERFAEVYPKGIPSYGGAEVLSVTAADEPVEHSLDPSGTLLTLRLDGKGKQGDRLTFRIREDLRLANCKHRLGYYGDYYTLSRFYPELCPYRDGAYAIRPFTPFGDPFVTESSDFTLALTLPANYVVAASAIEERREDQGTSKQLFYSQKGARDFALVASPLLRKRSGKAGSVPIDYYFANDKYSAETIAHVEKCLTFFSETFGAYPYSSYTVVSAPFFEAGMEHSALAILSNELSSSQMQETILHETAHQWWFGKVGNDEFLSPWMDEGLAEYATAYFYKAQGSNAAYRAAVKRAESAFATRLAIKGAEGARMDLPLSEMAEGYWDRVYAGGLLLFHELAQSVGHDRLNAALRRYADRFAGKIASPEDLITTLSAALAEDCTEFFRLRLSASLPIL